MKQYVYVFDPHLHSLAHQRVSFMPKKIEDEIPSEDINKATESFNERLKEQISINQDLTSSLNKLRNNCITDVQSLIDERQRKTYLNRHKETREKIINIPFNYESTTEGIKKEHDDRRNLVKKEQDFINTLKVDKDKVKKTHKDYIGKSDEILNKYLEPKEKAPYVTVDHKDLPKKTDNPWRWYHPPYYDEWGTTWHSGSRGGRWATHYENRYSGQIETRSHLWLYGADDSDYGYSKGYSEIHVWYQMPAAGIIEAWLYLQNIYGNYNGCMDDEWGWSDANIYQRSKPYMKVYYPKYGIRYGTLLNFHVGECDCCWAGKVAWADPGDFRYSHLLSPHSFAAGAWVKLAFGIYDYNYFWVNDMSVNLSMTNRWFLHHLAIKLSGAP